MSLPNQKSSQIGLFMSADDDVALDHEIDAERLGAVWESSVRYGTTPSRFSSLTDALGAGGGTQAFLRPVDWDATDRPAIQYWCGRSSAVGEGHLRAGRVAYRWWPATTVPALGTAFQQLADEVVAAARRVTLPHVVDHDGRPVRRYRIGRDAAAWYLEDPWPGRELRDGSTFATYRLRSEFGPP